MEIDQTMSIASDRTHVTLEELLASPDAGRFEIVNGQLEEVHVSNLSTEVAAALFQLLRVFCEANNLGKVFAADTYFQCFGNDRTRARRPDVCFVSRDRLPANWLEQSYFTIAPDLAIEVISQNDTAYEVSRKIRDYRGAGVKLIWEIDPENRTVLIHRLDGSVQMLQDSDNLSGENIVPGFTCVVRDFLP
jgi:Uma2 family endonuclease